MSSGSGRPALVGGFKVQRVRGSAPERLVAPLGVEERQILPDQGPRLSHVVVGPEVDLLAFQATPQSLDA